MWLNGIKIISVNGGNVFFLLKLILKIKEKNFEV